MTTTSDLRQVVQALYDLCGKGDWAGAEALLTEDFFVTEAPQLPYAGVYRGRSALREVVERVFGGLQVTGLDIHDITVGEKHAVGVLDMLLPGEPPLRVPVAEIFRFRDGKVCEIRPHYFDVGMIISTMAARNG
jgi:ketosteroid isomerase-like protein